MDMFRYIKKKIKNMSTTELKDILKKKIDDLDHDYFLEELLTIIDLETSNNNKFQIPEEHQENLEESLNQLDSGKTITHNQVIQDLKNDIKG